MRVKWQNVLIFAMALIIVLMIVNLVPSKEEEALKEQQKKIEEEQKHYDAILTEMEEIDLQQSLMELETAKAEKFIDTVSDDVEFILRTEEGSCVTTHNNDTGKNDFELFFTHRSIEVTNYYKAIFSIPTDKIHTQVIEGKIYLDYDIKDIEIKSIEITDTVPVEDVALMGHSYSKEELLALVQNAKEYLYDNLLTQETLLACADNLESYLLQYATQCGLNEVYINADKLVTEVGYEFVEMPTLTNNHPNKPLSSVDALVVHSTSVKDIDAKKIYDNFENGDRKASAHFVVDDKQVLQCLPTNMTAWAVGKGSDELGLYNSNTISIEICEYTDAERQQKAIDNAVEFINILKSEVGCSNVVMHRQISPTICPEIISDDMFVKLFK